MWIKNLSLKITALGLALLLWFHVATDRDYDYTVALPLRSGALPDGFALAEPLPDQVRFVAYGTGKELMRLLWESGHAELSLDPWVDTMWALTSDRLLLAVDANVRVKHVVEPATIRVHVDTVIRRAVRAVFQGNYATAAGISLVGPPKLEPSQVTLTGPRAAVAGISSVVTAPVDIGVLDQSTQREMPLVLDDSYNVTAMPASVTVLFHVAPSLRRDIEGIPVRVPRGFKADPPVVTFSVSGAEARLDALGLEYYRAAATPAPDPADDSLLSVEATVPPLVEILAVTPDRVRVFRP